MDWRSECIAVIPCLNEAEAIADVVRAVRNHLPRVLVLDDGSTDETALRAREAGAEVLRHERPLGKGVALADGWRQALKQGVHWALAMDGDGQHSPDDIPALLDCAERTGAAMVVGNRMQDPVGMPWIRKRVNHWMSRRITKLTGANLPDTQNGFRLMDLREWVDHPVKAGHFEIESEVLLSYALRGLRIEFVPIQVIYSSEESKIHPVRDTLRWFRWFRRARRTAQRMARDRTSA